MSRSRSSHAERANDPLAMLRRVLRVARSAYYAWVCRGVAAHARRRQTSGAPRVHAALRAGGVRCARKRFARLMRAAALVGCHRRRRARTTVANPAHAPAPNLVARDCTAPTPERRWLGDSTYVLQRVWYFSGVSP